MMSIHVVTHMSTEVRVIVVSLARVDATLATFLNNLLSDLTSCPLLFHFSTLHKNLPHHIHRKPLSRTDTSSMFWSNTVEDHVVFLYILTFVIEFKHIVSPHVFIEHAHVDRNANDRSIGEC